MITSNDFKTGMTIELKGEIYQIIEFLHVKPGKGAAFVRSKIKNLRTGATVDHTFKGGEKVAKAHIDKKTMQYLYNDGMGYVLMDTETFEQITLPPEKLGEDKKFIKENMMISILMYGEEVIGLELPNFVELEVTETEPGIKGDTASGGSKSATLETKAVVQVPLFIEQGDVIKIDTRKGEYMERV
jgi:elongation factor P